MAADSNRMPPFSHSGNPFNPFPPFSYPYGSPVNTPSHVSWLANVHFPFIIAEMHNAWISCTDKLAILDRKLEDVKALCQQLVLHNKDLDHELAAFREKTTAMLKEHKVTNLEVVSCDNSEIIQPSQAPTQQLKCFEAETETMRRF